MNDSNLTKTKVLTTLVALCVSVVGRSILAAETDTPRQIKVTVHETHAIPAVSRGQAHFSATTSRTERTNTRRKKSQTPARERLQIKKVEVSVKAVSDDAQSTAAKNQSVQAKPKETGLAVLKKAAQSKKYLFALFRKEENAETVAMRKVVHAAMKQAGDRALSAEMDMTSEKPLVERLRLQGAPTPLLLAIAPNGAITAGFPFKAQTEQLVDAIVSPGTADCLKALQDRKLLFLCIQNAHTKSNAEAMRGVHTFQQDERFSQDTELVRLDPADAAEAKFLADLEVDPKTKQAVTVFFAPLSGRIGTFEGETNLDELVRTLVEATSGFG